MLIAVLLSAFLTFALLISALIIAMSIRKSRLGKRKLYIAHRILAVGGICFAVIHAFLAYNLFIHSLF
jgi:hypothetical protein